MPYRAKGCGCAGYPPVASANGKAAGTGITDGFAWALSVPHPVQLIALPIRIFRLRSIRNDRRPSGVLTSHRTLQAPAICRRISQPFDSRLRKFSLWTNALTIETRVMPNILPKKHTAAGIILYHLRGSQVALWCQWSGWVSLACALTQGAFPCCTSRQSPSKAVGDPNPGGFAVLVLIWINAS